MAKKRDTGRIPHEETSEMARNEAATMSHDRKDGSGKCDQCHARFDYSLIHNGFADTATRIAINAV